ncbi:CocE/NonD family hydrolase C-terminal non-catalytic domain-containing protein [Streptomyces sp. NPDC021212]|uniref:CocE/NonD family hydrolase C-terminal non-catalytic domain-containing protein n=1 Tax=Streptomyces sp. NPDC021212 TaxID=3365118 RepID=UPI0037933E5E
MDLTEGIVRCRFHRSYEKPESLTPGQVYEIEVTAPGTANRFAAGHRIRLDISSSNFPRFDVNTNTGPNRKPPPAAPPSPRTPCTWTPHTPPTCGCGWKEERRP